jgi:hypothetical protein
VRCRPAGTQGLAGGQEGLCCQRERWRARGRFCQREGDTRVLAVGRDAGAKRTGRPGVGRVGRVCGVGCMCVVGGEGLTIVQEGAALRLRHLPDVKHIALKVRRIDPGAAGLGGGALLGGVGNDHGGQALALLLLAVAPAAIQAWGGVGQKHGGQALCAAAPCCLSCSDSGVGQRGSEAWRPGSLRCCSLLWLLQQQHQVWARERRGGGGWMHGHVVLPPPPPGLMSACGHAAARSLRCK